MVSFPAQRVPHSRLRNAWDALDDIEVFIYAAEAAFARWTRLGLWRRLGQRLAFD